MTADECRRKLSLREVAAWSHLISKEFDQKQEQITQPLLTEYYLMQVALEVRALTYCMSDTKKPLNLEEFIIKFNDSEQSPKKSNIQQQTVKGQAQIQSQFVGSKHIPNVPDFEKWQQQSMKS